MSHITIRNIGLFIAVAAGYCALLQHGIIHTDGGDDDNPRPSAELPIDAPGFHFVMVRQRDGELSPSLAAVVNSQLVEDEVVEASGTYRVYFEGEPTEKMPEAYRDIFAKMSGEKLPQFCVSNGDKNLYHVGPVPEDINKLLAIIRKVAGAV